MTSRRISSCTFKLHMPQALRLPAEQHFLNELPNANCFHNSKRQEQRFKEFPNSPSSTWRKRLYKITFPFPLLSTQEFQKTQNDEKVAEICKVNTRNGSSFSLALFGLECEHTELNPCHDNYQNVIQNWDILTRSFIFFQFVCINFKSIEFRNILNRTVI